MTLKFLQSIQVFLSSVDASTLARGRSYFSQGRVATLDCLKAGELYSAMVEGGDDYVVGLELTNQGWATECSCPMSEDCKHVVAALLALREDRGTRDRAGTDDAAGVEPHRARKEPRPTSFRAHVEGALGRKLRSSEAGFADSVQELYQQSTYKPLWLRDISQLATNGTGYNPSETWKELDLWPKPPRGVLEFWLYVAWELRRRGWNYPEFMTAVTDLSQIAGPMGEWERQREVEHWTQQFRNYSPHSTLSEPGQLDLRLMILPKEARFQWRNGPERPFTELKQTQAKDLAEQFEQGNLVLAPDSLLLWSAAYRPWQTVTWWCLKYHEASGRSALTRILRQSLPLDRVVTAEGEPLARIADPLQVKLEAPQNGDQKYHVALTTAEGTPPPPICCMLNGRPTLYLTARALYHGPLVEFLGTELRTAIPGDALETADGLRFLHAHKVPYPDHLQSRVQQVRVNVAIACSVVKPYSSRDIEDIVIEVTGSAPGFAKEKFTPYGWEDTSRGKREKLSKNERGKLVVHDREAQKHFPRLLDALGVKWDGYPGAWRLRLTKKTPEFFAEWMRSVPPDVELLLDDELATLRDGPIAGKVSLDLTEAGIDWFDLKVVLNVADATLTQEELKLLLNARGGYVRLGKKGWRRLEFDVSAEEDEQLARLGLNPRDFSAEPQRLHAFQLADEAARRFLPPDRVEKIHRRASELKTRVTPPVPSAIRAEMRPYQSDGFHFLAYLTTNRFGGVLADDMGLGKTIQTLAWLAWLREQNTQASLDAQRPSLVVCPKSVMDNWRAESERFYPGLRVRLWRGEPAAELSGARESADVIVVNYSQLRSLWPAVGDMEWFTAILDEAQYIKNPDSQTAQAARGLRAEHRLALTGTPIENRLLDLWSILAFAMPGVLGNRAMFLRSFDAKDDPLARRRLAARVRPFLLRRTKAQVAKDLPDRVEEDLLCQMEGTQQTLYRAELKRAQQLLLGLKTNQQLNKERFNILTSLLRLRQICCHPALVDAKLLEKESAKLDALEDLLEPLMEEGHKVLVFSQFVTMLDLLRQKMQERNWPLFYLAGSTENRGELVQQFQSAPGGAVFLISLKAGGFGLNLTAASYVVLFDPWWNPAVENQAIDRTHRIGQSSKVIAYRLLMRDSVEQKIRALQKEKAALADDVLGEERFAQSLTLADLKFLFSD